VLWAIGHTDDRSRKEHAMTHRLFLVLAASTLVAASAGWAAAAGSHSMDVRLSSTTLVNGTKIPSGNYSLSWTRDDTRTVNVTIERRGHAVANAQAKIEERDNAAPQDEIITRTSKSGLATLEEVRLHGEKTALVFSAS
jgi:hypothetical protein